MRRSIDADTYVVLFKALSSNSRIMILRVLAERGEMSVEEITKHINLAGSTVSRHLQELRMQELVTVKHDAQNRYYSLDRERLADKLGSFLKGLGIAPAVPPAGEDQPSLDLR